MTASTAIAPAIDEFVRDRRLGSVATYRVAGGEGNLVELEVIDAPGLEPGQRFRFTVEAVAAMQAREIPESRNWRERVTGHERPRGLVRRPSGAA